MVKKNKKRNGSGDAIDNLARMVERGFAETATKADISEVNKKLDKIEFHMNTHERRIEILEDRMLMVSTKLGLRR